MANEYTMSQTGVVGDEFAMAKKAYDANVLFAFNTRLTAWGMFPSEDMMGGVSKDVIRYWKMSAGAHTPHASLSKQSLLKNILTFRMEDTETHSTANLSKRDELLNHWDASGAMSKLSGEALADLYDVQTLQALINAARTSATTVGTATFPGGQALTSPRATLATYTNNEAGSILIQTDMKEIHRKMFEDNVDMNQERYWFMPKALHDKLTQDTHLMSRDYVDQAFSDKIKGKLTMVDGAWLIPTNNYPSTNVTTSAASKAGVASYTGDFSLSVAVCCTRDALRKAEVESPTGIYFWDDDRRDWVIGAIGMKTIETYLPECAGEITVLA